MRNPTLDHETLLQADKNALDKAKAILGCPELPFHPFQAAFLAFNACYPGSGRNGWKDYKELHYTPSGSRLQYYQKLEEICRKAFRRPNISRDEQKAIAFGIHYFELVVEIIVSENFRQDSEGGVA